jgi:P-type E1-E2 ATPase
MQPTLTGITKHMLCLCCCLQVEVLRGGRFSVAPSTALVPGDVVAVTTGVLPADCVLLTGECIVDENMLTGKQMGHIWAVSRS